MEAYRIVGLDVRGVNHCQL